MMRVSLTMDFDLLDGHHVADVNAALLRAEQLGADSLRSSEVLREPVPKERGIGEHK